MSEVDGIVWVIGAITLYMLGSMALKDLTDRAEGAWYDWKPRRKTTDNDPASPPAAGSGS
jgi:hypothetical protein